MPALEMLFLVFSSASLYVAGMILNDVFDADIDLIERPHRPIPSRRINSRSAFLAGVSLLLSGIVLAAIAGWLVGPNSISSLLRPTGIAITLAIFILLYDGWLKKTRLAPALMGGCRTLNLLLGASTIDDSQQAVGEWLGFSGLVWWVAISLGVYVTGITMFARKEAVFNQNRGPLITAALVVGIGILGMAFVNFVRPAGTGVESSMKTMFPLIIGLIGLPIFRRIAAALAHPTPLGIQTAVVTCLRSIIILDAALCFMFAPQQPLFALTVVGLLIPALLFGRWLSPT